jgi:hypothetical protein
MILRHFYKEKINGKKYKIGGLKRNKKEDEDPRNLQLGWLGIYTPKHDKLNLEEISVKDQALFNTCTQAALTGIKEPDEKCELSEQSLTCLAKENGVITGDGMSTLQSILKIMQKFGIAEKRLLDKKSSNWEEYSSVKHLTQEIRDNAYIHRIQSYWQVIGRNARLKALDDGYRLYTGIDWYSGWLMNGGFKLPWLIRTVVGWLIGGHAIYIKGYDLDYNGVKAYRFKNSWGSSFADNGDFYVDMDFFDKVGHLTYAILDIPIDTARFIANMQGKFVKVKGQPQIYYIQEDTKRLFPNKAVFYCWGGRFGLAGNWEFVDKELLDSIKTGEPMKIEESPAWPKIAEIWEEIKVLDDMNMWAKIEEKM